MTHKTFSISIPIEFYDPLKDEADGEFRSLNQQINAILKERYHANNHAPPTQPVAKSRNGHSKQNGRKKATV